MFALLAPPTVVTNILAVSAVPEDLEDIVAVMVVEFTTMKLATATPPTVTDITSAK